MRRLIVGVAAVFALVGLAPGAWAYQQPEASPTNPMTLPSGFTASVAGTSGAAGSVAPTGSRGSYGDTRDASFTPSNVKDINPDWPMIETPLTGPADGAYHPVGTLTLTMSRPLRNPRIHFDGLMYASYPLTRRYAQRLTLTTPGASLNPLSGWTGWSVSNTVIAPDNPRQIGGTARSTCQTAPAGASPYGCGSIEVPGNFTTLTFNVEVLDDAQFFDSYPGSFSLLVTADEDCANASVGGDASHVRSDLALGATVALDKPTTSSTAACTEAASATDANPTFAPLKTSAAGSSYSVTVPVSGVTSSAALAGWIDFDRNGTLDAGERATATVAPGATSATLSWTVPPSVQPGEAAVRLRLGYDAAQVGQPAGMADSGEVEDYKLMIEADVPAVPIVDARWGAPLALVVGGCAFVLWRRRRA